MGTVVVNKKDELVMKLTHYFITEENYIPIVVNGVKDEIWLENNDAFYKIVRINSNYIHNNEQYEFDILKTQNVMRQVKRKTFSLKMKSLNIFLDVNPTVDLLEEKNIASVFVENIKDIKKHSGVAKFFPSIKEKLINDTKGIDLIVNVTKDINEKREKENKTYENVFKPKKIVVVPILIIINIIVFLLTNFGLYETIVNNGALYKPAVLSLELWRIISCAFIHVDVFHLLMNMYALYVIGNQIETFVGKRKFLSIYFISAIGGSMMSLLFTDGASIGASGAIFGLMGALAYFSYQYRLYMADALKHQIIPILVLNIAIGFIFQNIDVAAHIGGLITGIIVTMALGVNGKSSAKERINGWIVLAIYLVFMSYLVFFRN